MVRGLPSAIWDSKERNADGFQIVLASHEFQTVRI